MLSLAEHQQILKEVGMSSGGGGDAESIKVQHVFLFTMNEDLSRRWEKIFQRAVDGWLQLGRHVVSALVPTLQVFILAASLSLVLYGASHLVRSLRGSERSADNGSEK